MASTRTIQRIARVLKIVGWVSPQLAGEIALQIFTTPQRIPRPDWEAEIARQGSLRFGPGQIVARSFGPLGAPTVLLIHGWEGRGLQLGLLIDPLLRRGFRVIAVDAPAHGDSYGRRVNIARFAESIVRLVEDLAAESRAPVSVVAHSFGACASALALLNGAGFERAILVAAPSTLITVADNFAEMLSMSHSVADAFRERLRKWTGLAADQVDLALRGTQMAVPTMIVHDPGDKIVSFWHAERFVAQWPQARLFQIEKIGHFKILKSPAFLDEAVKFLEAPTGNLKINLPKTPTAE